MPDTEVTGPGQRATVELSNPMVHGHAWRVWEEREDGSANLVCIAPLPSGQPCEAVARGHGDFAPAEPHVCEWRRAGPDVDGRHLIDCECGARSTCDCPSLEPLGEREMTEDEKALHRAQAKVNGEPEPTEYPRVRTGSAAAGQHAGPESTTTGGPR